MRNRVPSLKSFNAHEQQRLMMPLLGFTVALVGIIFGASLLSYFRKDYEQAIGLLQGTIWGLYVLAIHLVIVHRKWEIDRYRWILPVLNGIGLGFLIYALPSSVALLALYFYLASIFIYCITAGRGATYAVILSTAGIYVLLESLGGFSSQVLIIAFSFVSSGIVMAELLLRLFNVIMFRARRLDIINEFARKIALSIESSQVLTLLNAAIESAMDADTYFVAMLDDDGKIRLDLFYDDGEFFPPMTLDGQGTLSGWVLRNRRPLFLPDLRSEPDLEGVTVTIIGRERTSLSWMGVPILSSHFTGLISIASYTPNAFDRMDMELLENLAQHAASAMENAFHHAEVEHQSQTDSLTGALNHGAFLLALEKLAEDTQPSDSPLSLIMLDVDFFKSYNDTYGHLFGDKVLQALTQTIREHIKGQDVVGRWGGEEFAVILPHTTGANAILVCRRIQETMYQMRMEHPEKGLVPAPTVSQGIAVYPLETRDVYQLVDIADHRLYLAKERGRNQVEPQEDAWMIPGTDEQGTDTDELESRAGYY
jgi:diguanylate cyclase (GGDEF)-like protein